MNATRHAVLVLALAFVLAPRLPAQETLPARVDPDRLRADVAFLSDDALAGRLGGTDGEARAADYLVGRFRAIGLDPPGPDGHLQTFPLVDQVVARRGRLSIGDRRLRLHEGFHPFVFGAGGSVEGPAATGSDGPLDGRVAVLPLAGEVDPARRVLAAQEAGAVAVVLVADRERAPRTPGVLSPSESRRLSLLAGALRLVQRQVVRILGTFQLGGLDPRVLLLSQPEMVEMVATRDADERVPPGPWSVGRRIRIPVVAIGSLEIASGTPIALEIEIDRERIESRNVVAVLPATVRPAEAGLLVVGAHFDHVGSTRPPGRLLARLAPRDDYIWNGADDNASGTAAILEVARLLALADGPRRRTIVFVAFGSEEYGLVGSQWFVDHPVIDIDRVVGMLNLDMVGRNPDQPLLVAGASSAGHLPDLLERANRSLARPLDLTLNDRYIDRSDQASFLARGVPVLFFSSGEHPDYHEASDELENLSLDRVADATRLAVALVSEWAGAAE